MIRALIMSNNKQLPRQSEPHIIDISIKHFFFSFLALFLSISSFLLIITWFRNYLKIRRQKVLLESLKEIIKQIQTVKRS